MPESNKDEFAKLLNRRLDLRGQSGRELARQLQVHPSTVARWRNGETLPENVETIQLLLHLLGVRDREERQAFYDAAGYLVRERAEPGEALPALSSLPQPAAPVLPTKRESARPIGQSLWSSLLALAGLALVAALFLWQIGPNSREASETPPLATSTPGAATLCGESARRAAPPANRFLRTEGVSAYTGQNTDGLVLNDSVRSLAIDSRGLWIGYFPPPAGVGHYDGAAWADCTGGLDFPVTKVNAIVIDGAGWVWAGTESDGVALFDGTAWRQFTTANGLPSAGIFGLTLQKGANGEERVWAATWEGAARFDGDRWSVPYSVHNGTLVNNHIHDIEFDGAGNVWIAYVNQGISQFDGEGGRWIHYKRDGGSIGGDEMRAILVRPAGIGGNEDEPESVWFASGDGGVSRYQQGAWTVYTTSAGLPSLNVINLALDSQGRVWAATEGGDAFFDGSVWQTRTRLPTRAIAFGPVCAACPFDADDVWTGTDGSGVAHSGLPLPEPVIDLLGVALPAVVAPGQPFRPEITVAPRSPYRLKPGDLLAHIDEADDLRFGAWPHLAVTQIVEPGQPFTFTDYDLPFIAPNLSDGETERTFTSAWRLWMDNRYVGPVIPITFTVAAPE
ncbi:MAG: hypothetical protein HY328_12075 [Chloroflexi bacterium]|nr:hypothetical protein [Chloroflexota bacterium]